MRNVVESMNVYSDGILVWAADPALQSIAAAQEYPPRRTVRCGKHQTQFPDEFTYRARSGGERIGAKSQFLIWLSGRPELAFGSLAEYSKRRTGIVCLHLL